MPVQDIALPAVGENITTGTVIKVSVAVGDSVKKDQDLLELETDKASLPVPSPVSGVVKEILIKEGQEVKIGAVVMRIDAGASTPSETSKIEPAKPTEAPKKSTAAPVAAAKPTPAASTPVPAPVAPSPAARNVAAAPSVRRLARELGVDLAQVPGSGPGGRISKEDVKEFTKRLVQSGGGGTTPVSRALPDFSKYGNIRREKMNNIRRKTAEHMSYCWNTIPHVTQFGKADITELEKLRKRYSTNELKLTVTPFLMKVIASAVKTFPKFNSSLDMTAQEIIYKDYIHIGVAVDTERGLLVPVIRNVDEKTIFQIADELNAVAERARAGKITLDDLQGSSMTVTNLGGIGGTAFTPIVNWPEVAILGVSRGANEPVFENDHFVPRFMLPLSLSYDHRVIDGADGARFLRWVCEAIEQPFLMELG